MRRLFRLLVMLALFGGVGAAAWWWLARPPLVRADVVTLGPAVDAVYATGTVEPVLWARIGPLVKGRLIALEAEEGERVRAGQVLARLDDSVARAQLAEAEARASFLREEAGRLRALAAREIVAQAALDRAESEARAAAAVVAAARQRLDDFVMRAPMEGLVLRRDGEIGEVVDTGNTVFVVGERRPLRVTAEVDEEDILRVEPGQRVLLKADALPGRVLEGRLAEITPKGDPRLKVYRVRIALPDDTPLLVGMTVEANIIVREEPQAVLAPAASVRDGAVFVVEGDVVRRVPVRLGVQGPLKVEALSGLAPGMRVVTDPPATLADDMRVRLPANALAH
ncbi:efflux RND transporter periplasmic adaptor subunit [Elioraea sp. Yellowstone]|uniref:efflux RND transporter periplasmic adaptor subunit n=1 Tax=Elioraea sp. Yellowstone TaxID=2592070 RepID=UPI001151B6B2|nr:efflux RND transporter periplasmic adaptor subunit [Elioraea sp. Yellowstone]TQF83080.1 efflux RND transporter periplasmic adaptor subunit [Elioraea sp. Yellowstone]